VRGAHDEQRLDEPGVRDLPYLQPPKQWVAEGLITAVERRACCDKLRVGVRSP